MCLMPYSANVHAAPVACHARRQKRNSFQQIGFANTIRPGQNNSWRRKLQLRPTIVAKIINHQFRQP
jgi:hypothetical protein